MHVCVSVYIHIYIYIYIYINCPSFTAHFSQNKDFEKKFTNVKVLEDIIIHENVNVPQSHIMFF